MRPLLELTLLKRLSVALPGQTLLLLIASATIAALAGDTILFWLDHFSTRGFFNLPAADGHLSYARALPMLMLMTSGLMVIKGLVRALLLVLGTGQLYQLRLRFHAFGVSLGVSDISTHTMTRLGLLLYFIGTSASFIAVAAVLPSYVQEPHLVRTFETLAVLLTLLELDPYRRSDRAPDRPLLPRRRLQADDGLPQKSALFSAANTGKGFGGEARLVAYSSLALLWTVGFALYALDLLSSNYPSLVIALASPGEPAARVSAAVLLVVLLAVFGTLFFDLLSTIARNIIFPLLTPYLRLSQRISVREISDFDRAGTVDRLAGIAFFSDMPRDSLIEMAASSKLKAFRRGTRLIIQGDPGQELFVSPKRRRRAPPQTRPVSRTESARLRQAPFSERSPAWCATAPAPPMSSPKTISARWSSRKPRSGSSSRAVRIATTSTGSWLRSPSGITYRRYLLREMPAETLGVFRELGQFESHKPGDLVIAEGAEDRSFYLRASRAVRDLEGRAGRDPAQAGRLLRRGRASGKRAAHRDRPLLRRGPASQARHIGLLDGPVREPRACDVPRARGRAAPGVGRGGVIACGRSSRTRLSSATPTSSYRCSSLASAYRKALAKGAPFSASPMRSASRTRSITTPAGWARTRFWESLSPLPHFCRLAPSQLPQG